MGAACPLDRTNSSLPQSSGSLTLYLISLKKRQAMRSAIETQLVGWPEPARVVMRREWMRSRAAIFWRTSALVIDFILSYEKTGRRLIIISIKKGKQLLNFGFAYPSSNSILKEGVARCQSPPARSDRRCS